MPMNLGDLLEMVRQDYLDTLNAAAAEAGAGTQREPLLHDTPALGTVLWGDLKVGSRMVTVASEGVFQFEERIIFGWGDELPGQPAPLQVVVQPFAWEAMAFTLTPASGKQLNPEPLLQWLDQWSAEPEPEETEPTPDQGRGVVHSLKAGAKPGSYIADMGSAPLEAWQDVLEAALAAGAAQIIVGHG